MSDVRLLAFFITLGFEIPFLGFDLYKHEFHFWSLFPLIIWAVASIAWTALLSDWIP